MWIARVGVGALKKIKNRRDCLVISVRLHHLKMETRSGLAERMETDLRFTVILGSASGRPLWSIRISVHLVL